MEPREESQPRVVMARLVKRKDADRSFDIEFWQAQSSEARFRAAWELVEHYLRQQGREDELELQRSVVSFRPARS